MAGYATPADLTGYLAGGDYAALVPADPTRLLDRAWEVIDDHTTGMVTLDDVTGLPDEATTAALVKATCQQVEQWMEVGEENDIAGLTGAVSSGGVSVTALPDTLAPRAKRTLRLAGLLSDVPPRPPAVTVTLE